MAASAVARAAGLLCLSLLLPSVSAARSRRVAGGLKAKAPEGSTPVQKVTELLKELVGKCEADGKREVEQYEKYSNFCRRQDSDKTYAIGRSSEKIAKLEARAEDLQGEIAELTSSIMALKKKIAEKQADFDVVQTDRDSAVEEHNGKVGGVEKSIKAVEKAIAAMKESKAQLTDEAKADLFAQIRAVSAIAEGELKSALGQPAYKYKSNDIISILKSLLQKFTAQKERLYQEEFEAQTAFEARKQAWAIEKRNTEKEIAEMEKLEAERNEELHSTQKEKMAEAEAKKADQAFLKELTTQCEEKAKDYEERTKTRAEELAALTKALEALETGVTPNYKANRRVTSLLQVEGAHHAVGTAIKKQVVTFLEHSAEALKSSVLSLTALRVKATADHFVKVRSIIKDIIARLEEQAESEANTKSFCDKGMTEAITSRDAKAEELESLTGEITEKSASKKTKMKEIAELAEAIAANQKALKEATELRESEHKDNTGRIEDAKAGKEAVEYAIQVLKDFYESEAGEASLLQNKYTPPDADRSGKGVSDMAPDMYEAGYKGETESSKSIIGMLEVILADFDRTSSTVGDQDTAAADEFDEFRKSNLEDTKSKEADKATKEEEVATLADELVDLEDKKRDAAKAKGLAEEELNNLRSMCVEGEETNAQRVAKREKELEALKQAHDILENWQG